MTKIYEENFVCLQLHSFEVKGGVKEYNVLLSGTDPLLTFPEQLANLLTVYKKGVGRYLEEGSVPVFRRYFLSDSANQDSLVKDADRELPACAVSVVEQPPLNGTKVALWVYIQAGMEITVRNKGLTEVSHNGYRHFWTGGRAHPDASGADSQTRVLLTGYIAGLEELQCSLAENCIRTWFFVQNVDVNYAGVVTARKEVFITQGLTEKTHYIASTGIQGRHAEPAAVVQLDAYAVKGVSPQQITYLYAPGYLNPTYEYGVTFERGTAVTYGDRRHIFISGTASIDNRGEIVFPGDIRKQTRRMLENVDALLQEGGASLEDIAQAVVYVRDPADYLAVKQYLEANCPFLPYLLVWAPVCRPGWLIEMECMAIVPIREPAFACL